MQKILFILSYILLFSYCTNQSKTIEEEDAPSNRININGQEVFLSGMNLAWMNFAADLDSFDVEQFTLALDQISKGGGNSLRWWLHTNGRYSPVFTNDTVSGIRDENITAIKTALDLAYERGIIISLCLWSFDMLQNEVGKEKQLRNKYLLEDSSATMAYINNALIPLVKALKGHPGILCWEIFNEPEGMAADVKWGGWTPIITEMKYIQRFVNLCAGAIHRIDSNAYVSNGTWSFRVGTDVRTIHKNYNYYRDDRLIAAGGDEKGTLDFYMIHYYDWAKKEWSPFHHPASYWELDKPIVIAEFSAKGPYRKITPKQAYEILYNNGYAGSLSWTWTNHDGHGGVKEAAEGMLYLRNNFPEDVILKTNKKQFTWIDDNLSK